MRWNTLLFLAEKTLAEGGGDTDTDFSGAVYSNAALKEARLRAAISRAYYAAFHAAKDKWESFFPHDLLPRDSPHQKLMDNFGFSTQREWRTLSDNLKQLRDWRHQADYHDQFPNLEDTASFAIGRCDTILETTRDLKRDA